MKIKIVTLFLLYLVTSLFVSQPLSALAAQLFEYKTNINTAKKTVLDPNVYQISINPDIFDMEIGSEFELNILGQPSIILVHDRKYRHKNNDLSWFAYLKELGKGYRVSLIKGKNIIRGRILTPEGLFLINQNENETILEDLQSMEIHINPIGMDDFRVKNLTNFSVPMPRRIKEAAISEQTTIDLMILYNQEMSDKFPGASLETRFNEMIEIANQACIDSQINMSYRIVHTALVNCSNTISNDTALDDLTDGLGAFSNIDSLRREHGADLVTLIRPYEKSHHNSCGMAWLNGSQGLNMAYYADTGFSVISEGRSGNYYCDDTTLAHELGHNMGCAHDRDHASFSGAYSYSYGYDKSGYNAFGTIMSYDGPTLNYFSNPDISACNGQPCGSPEGNTDSADNARSMNNTRDSVAAFMPTVYTSDTIIYFPHIASNQTWETEICLISKNDSGPISGTLRLYNANGQQLGNAISLSLESRSRKAYIVGDDFTSPDLIKYITFEVSEEHADQLAGYTKFYISGQSRVALPIVKTVPDGPIYLPHIASNESWWTGIGMVNTNSESKTITIEFDNGQNRTIQINGGEHKRFTVKSLFNGVPQADIKSAVMRQSDGIVGFILYCKGNQLTGIKLNSDTADRLLFPHIASNLTWWTGIVAYNPSGSESDLTITTYTSGGQQNSNQVLELESMGKYRGTAGSLGFDDNAAWFKIESEQEIVGFELFGTWDEKILAGYSVVDINASEGVFPKLEKNGWTGIAFVNTTNQTVNITLTAYNDSGGLVQSVNIELPAYGKWSGNPVDYFGTNINRSTYLVFSSSQNIVSFQLNGSTDGFLLDSLPGM